MRRSTIRDADAPTGADDCAPDVPSIRDMAATVDGPVGVARSGFDTAKRVVDAAVAAFALVLVLPLFVVLLVVVTVSTGSPFFVHRRLGRGGRPFPCLKFRTMHRDADRRLAELLATDPVARAEWDTDHKLRADPRVTGIGRILRRTNLDELPQLVNVLLGHMSLIGPRPIVEEEQARYGPAFDVVSSIRPGLTGLWQVSGRNALPYRRRVELDVDYVFRRGVALDSRILLRTLALTIRAIAGDRSAGGV